MSANSLGSPDPAGERPADSAGDAKSRPPVDPELLEDVLRQILMGGDQAAAADPEAVAALKHLGERYLGHPFELDPLVVELVRAVLGEPYRRLAGSADLWRTMTAGVAQTLYDDPASRQRLHDLWRRLTGAEA